MQLRQSGGAIDLRDDDLGRGGVVAAAFQLIALREQFGARVERLFKALAWSVKSETMPCRFSAVSLKAVAN